MDDSGKRNDYFSVFGLKPRFRLSDAELSDIEKKFYEISRACHPDRFSAEGGERLAEALEKMSFLNEAYGTLKNPDRRRHYVLKLHGMDMPPDSRGAPGTMPMELAEAWFELQEAIMEGSADAPSRIKEFEATLETEKASLGDRFEQLEAEFDSLTDVEKAKDILNQLVSATQKMNYLNSLLRDLRKAKENHARSA